ncbi:hypothetical protein HaLaN_16373, partial [Haematococcus lacustris]
MLLVLSRGWWGIKQARALHAARLEGVSPQHHTTAELKRQSFPWLRSPALNTPSWALLWQNQASSGPD